MIREPFPTRSDIFYQIPSFFLYLKWKLHRFENLANLSFPSHTTFMFLRRVRADIYCHSLSIMDSTNYVMFRQLHKILTRISREDTASSSGSLLCCSVQANDAVYLHTLLLFIRSMWRGIRRVYRTTLLTSLDLPLCRPRPPIRLHFITIHLMDCSILLQCRPLIICPDIMCLIVLGTIHEMRLLIRWSRIFCKRSTNRPPVCARLPFSGLGGRNLGVLEGVKDGKSTMGADDGFVFLEEVSHLFGSSTSFLPGPEHRSSGECVGIGLEVVDECYGRTEKIQVSK
ncbi:hypothetical protein F5880DRAFT_735352 [Lentinula raphanica]|nr:hypothetical protein F5880DRAFT_735352 [Lentinula raphanica]